MPLTSAFSETAGPICSGRHARLTHDPDSVSLGSVTRAAQRGALTVRGCIEGKSIKSEPSPGAERQILTPFYRFVSLSRSEILENISHIVDPENRAGSTIRTADGSNSPCVCQALWDLQPSHCGSNQHQNRSWASLM